MHSVRLSRLYRISTSRLLSKRGIETLAKPEESEGESSHAQEEFVLDGSWKKWWKGSFSKHPGKCRISAVHLPHNFIESAEQYLSDLYKHHHRSKVMAVCEKLCDILSDRPLQMRPHKNDRIPSSRNNRNVPTKRELAEFLHPKTKDEIREEKLSGFKESLWKQIIYDQLNCAAYLVGRAPGVYAATLRVLSEIKKRDPEFQPASMLDYGSGTGTAVWAANKLWGSSLEDFFCVDWSQSINLLSQFLLTGGNENAELTGIYIRPFLPISFKHTYDVITAAYTLSELPSEKERLTTLKILWEKTNKYLVIIEQGNRQGYHMIMEARNLISNGIEGADFTKSNRTNSRIERGHIFAPCPHKNQCPKWNISPCSFKQSYFPPMYARRFHGNTGAREETFSYIILSKEEKGLLNWPRAISDPQSQSGKVRCHLCTHTGEIQHLYMKKMTHGKDIRHTVKKTLGGDLLPYSHNEEED